MEKVTNADAIRSLFNGVKYLAYHRIKKIKYSHKYIRYTRLINGGEVSMNEDVKEIMSALEELLGVLDAVIVSDKRLIAVSGKLLYNKAKLAIAKH